MSYAITHLSPADESALTAAVAHHAGHLPPLAPRERVSLIARGLATPELDYQEVPCPQLGGAMTITPVVTALRITGLARATLSAEHWRSIGKAYLLEMLHSYWPSKDGGLCVTRHSNYDWCGWQVCALDCTPGPYQWEQPTRRRALALAERIEALRLADGKPFDWNAPDRSKRLYEARLADGTLLMNAIAAIANEPEFRTEDR